MLLDVIVFRKALLYKPVTLFINTIIHKFSIMENVCACHREHPSPGRALNGGFPRDHSLSRDRDWMDPVTELPSSHRTSNSSHTWLPWQYMD